MGGQSLILLDTHCVLWLDQADQRMGRQARSRAEAAIRTGDLAVSAISFWEVAMLAGKGRLKMGRSLRLWRRDWLQQGMIELPLSGAIGIEAAALADFHADPADRWLVATAREVGATLLTADERILAWPGRLDRHDARV
jgi:PIN domain nuclease of toxin-antitoxin system